MTKQQADNFIIKLRYLQFDAPKEFDERIDQLCIEFESLMICNQQEQYDNIS